MLLGRYGLVEKVCGTLVLFMFVTMMGAAALTVPNLGDVAGGLVPRVPGVVGVLGVAGGVEVV